MLFKGRELSLDASLAEQGVGSGAVVTVVRRALAADGWKVGGWVVAVFVCVCSWWWWWWWWWCGWVG